MSRLAAHAGVHRSIFVKLLAIMAVTGVSLVLVVATVFWFLVEPGLSTSRRLIPEYTRLLAATAPDLATARQLSEQLGFRMRYEGPGGAWETAPGLPTIQEAQARPRHDLYVIPGAHGGTYLIAWDFHRDLMNRHTRMVCLLLLYVVAVLAVAHAVLRRSLRPVRSLHAGVTRLSEGELDVTVPRQTNDELGVLTDAFNQMVRRIGDMLRARDQLLLDVSHELRSPLTRIKVALELLPESDKRARIASDISEMEAMITELLELERLRDGRGIRPERQNLTPILREVVESFHDQPPGARLVAPPEPILLEIDGDQLRTVLRNLLDNAIKYSLPDSGPVEITIAETPGTVLVHISDDGPGIPEADLPHLFEPFFRVDRSRSRKSGGYGLGLSICKRILEAHGGGIAVENKPGRGARFMVTLRKPG
jgi:signal transduction histidine kinase